jgi:nucleoid-associated protein YgaU
MLAPAQTFAQAEVVCEQDIVVQADDWLSKIADKVYGDVLAFPAIVEATNAKAAVDSSYTHRQCGRDRARLEVVYSGV